MPAGLLNSSSLNLTQDESGLLHQLDLSLVYNQGCGFFAEFHSVFSVQSNRGYSPARPGDAFWQHHVFVGYRFPKRIAEIRLGVLNLTGRDYQLNPLNLYREMPRERLFTCMARFNF